MLKITLRSLWSHKRRMFSTVLSIVLGVAFMTGTFIFADTIDQVFDDLFAQGNENVDAQVQGTVLFSDGFTGEETREQLDLALVDEILAVDGAVRAAPFVSTIGFGSTNRILDGDGDAIGSSQGPPTLIESWIDDDLLNPYRLTSGSAAPTADNEVALNVAAAEEAGFALGDTVGLISQFGKSDYTLVGTFTFGEAESAAGAVSAEFTFAEAARLAGVEGGAQQILAGSDGSVSDEEFVRRIAPILPGSAEVITGEEAAAQQASDVQEGFGFFRVLLSVFGMIAIIVGIFVIYNTFQILVAQRTRELALMRAIGASRSQVRNSVLLEALFLGALAGALGLLGGVALATAVRAGLEASGAEFPAQGLVIRPVTIVTALGIGTIVTVGASLLPARQATKVPPLAALREVAVQKAGPTRARAVIGALTLLVGGVLLSAAFRGEGGSDALPSVGLGALLLIVGAIVVGPLLAEPSVRAIGVFLPRLRGVTGALSVENAARSPKRTSATAAALIIGVALIGFVTIFSASAQKSITAEVGRAFTADLVIQSSAGGFGPPSGYPRSVSEAAAAVDGVAEVSAIGFQQAQQTYPDGTVGRQWTTAIEPEGFNDVLDPTIVVGDLEDLTDGGVFVDAEIMVDKGLELGDVLTLTGDGAASVDVTIEGISEDITILGWFTVTRTTYDRVIDEPVDLQTFVSIEDGADLAAVQDRIQDAIADVPSMEVLDQEGFEGDLVQQISSFLTFITGLLLLSVIIAVIGIANTLSLSIHERTRELGLLRAVGMTRSQLRSAVRWEAVLISVLGTVVGLGLGVVLSYALVSSLDSMGLSEFDLPIGSLVFVVVFACLLGVVASLLPGWRASRMNVLDAISAD